MAEKFLTPKHVVVGVIFYVIYLTRNYKVTAQSQESVVPKTKFLSNLLDSYLFLSLLDANPKAQDRTLDVCPHVAKERDFLIIGHSGGDSNLECENTLEATEAVFQRSISKSMENVIRLQQNHSNSKAVPRTVSDQFHKLHVNAIELDLSLSKDNVIFLWHDPDPWDFVSTIRRSGYATRKCYPVMDILQPASTLNYNQIKNEWYYKLTTSPSMSVNSISRNDSVLLNQKVLYQNPNSTHRIQIRTLEEWLDKFVGLNTRSRYYQHLKLIWLDVKVPLNRLRPFAIEISKLIRKYKLQGHPDSIDIQFSSSKSDVGERLQFEIDKILNSNYPPVSSSNLIISPSTNVNDGHSTSINQRIAIELEEDVNSNHLHTNNYGVVTDTVSFLPYIGIWDMIKYNGVGRIVGPDGNSYQRQDTLGLQCGCCVNIGMPPFAINAWEGLKNIVTYNIRWRNEHFRSTGTYIYVYVWTIDNPSQMNWLIKAGVDGIITNKPNLLESVYNKLLRNHRRNGQF